MKKIPVLSSVIILSVILACSCHNGAPSSASLPRSTPEAEGVESAGINAFLDSVMSNSHELHSFMFLRHGKVIAEGWWNPYRPDLRHTLYSTSKSFTSTAVGFAVSENRLSLSDRVISFFPDELSDSVSSNLAEMKISDLLMMSAGQPYDPTGEITTSGNEWVKAFLKMPVDYLPGSRFLYNSMATYMLSAIVQKVTGEKVIDYLTPRLFVPLGISGMDWEVSPEGINTGGWGLRLRTEDMARFGQMLLHKGEWNGREVVPSEWVEEATTYKINQNPDAPDSVRAQSDWLQGYCYQFWRCRHNAFRGDGAFGQYIIVMPEKDAVVAITSETNNMQDEINMVWDCLLPAMKEEALPADSEASARLTERLAALALPVPPSVPAPAIAKEISGKRYLLEENVSGIKSLEFSFSGDTCTVMMETADSTYRIPFGNGRWVESTTGKDGPDLIRRRGALTSFLTAGAYTWSDDGMLDLVLRYIESPHHIEMKCRFDGATMKMDFFVSTPPGKTTEGIRGAV